MKKYIINYAYDDKDKKFVAVCPELFGFVLYCKNVVELKVHCLQVLKVYTKNHDLTGKDVEFVEKSTEYEVEKSLEQDSIL